MIRALRRGRDLIVSAAAVAMSPLVGAIAGAIILTAATATMAYLVVAYPEDASNRDFTRFP